MNCCCPLLGSLVEVGDTETDTAVETVTVAAADLVVSATLVALTVYVPAAAGAVYKPALLTVPPEAVQVTDVLLVPETLALNWYC